MKNIYYDSGARNGAYRNTQLNSANPYEQRPSYSRSAKERGIENGYANASVGTDGKKVMTTDDFMEYYSKRAQSPSGKIRTVLPSHQTDKVNVRSQYEPDLPQNKQTPQQAKQSIQNAQIRQQPVKSQTVTNRTEERRGNVSNSGRIIKVTSAQPERPKAPVYNQASQPNCSYSSRPAGATVRNGANVGGERKGNVNPERIKINREEKNGPTQKYSARATMEYNASDTLKYIRVKSDDDNNKNGKNNSGTKPRKRSLADFWKNVKEYWSSDLASDGEECVNLPVAKEKQTTDNNKTVKILSLSVIATILTVAMSMLLIVGSSVMVANATSELNAAKDEVIALQEQAAEKQIILDLKNDEALIEKLAVEEYGMIKKDFVTAKYIKLDDSDTVRMYEDSDGNGKGSITMSALLSAIDALFK